MKSQCTCSVLPLPALCRLCQTAMKEARAVGFSVVTVLTNRLFPCIIVLIKGAGQHLIGCDVLIKRFSYFYHYLKLFIASLQDDAILYVIVVVERLFVCDNVGVSNK